MACKHPPLTDAGQKLYALLQQACRKELKRVNWRKANQILVHFETGFIGEGAMIGGTRKLLKLGKQLPPELEDRDDD